MLDRTEFITRAGLLLRLMEQLLERNPKTQGEYDDIQRDWETLQQKWQALMKSTKDEGLLRLLREVTDNPDKKT